MKKIFLIYIFFFLLGSTFVHSADDKFVLVIDAGHGGRDTGATRGEYKEKSINLGVALALGKLIESNMKDVRVVYTRRSDVFVDLYKRAEIANKAKANLFVSIHTNSTAAKTTTAQGADTYILGLARSEENLAVAKRENSVILLEDDYSKKYEGFDPNSPESYIIFEFMTDKYMEQSLEFASHVQKGFTNIARRKDRGVRQAGFLVLRESAMPSVLIELGFINNPTEAKYLASTTGQRSMASSIYSGIEKYIRDFNKKQGNVAVSPTRSNEPVAVATTTPVVRERPKQEDNRRREVASKPQRNTNTGNSSGGVFVSKNKDVNELQTVAVNPVDKTPREVVVEKRTETIVTETPVNNQDVPVVESRTTVSEKVPALNRNIKTNETKAVSSSGSTASKTSYPAGAVEYRVQFLISQRKLPANSPQFKGLSPVDEYVDGGIYKYTYGSTTSEAAALQIRKDVRTKFKDAFVVQFRDGKRIK